MKAHIDISALSSQIKTLIEKSVEKEVKAAMWSNIDVLVKRKLNEIKLELQTENDARIRSLLQNVTDSSNRPAFLATLHNDFTPPINSVIKFDHVITNIGRHYSPSNGIFTVPKDGLYMFSATTRSTAGTHLHCEIMVDSNMIVKMFGTNYDAGTGNAVLNLKRGDKVFVQKDSHTGEKMIGRHWSMFSGYFIA